MGSYIFFLPELKILGGRQFFHEGDNVSLCPKSTEKQKSNPSSLTYDKAASGLSSSACGNSHQLSVSVHQLDSYKPITNQLYWLQKFSLPLCLLSANWGWLITLWTFLGLKFLPSRYRETIQILSLLYTHAHRFPYWKTIVRRYWFPEMKNERTIINT